MVRKWGCPICEQTSNRNWNMRRHIERKHNRLGQPVDLLKLNEYQYRSRRNGILSEEQIPMQSGGFSTSSILPIYYHRQLYPYSNYKIRRQNQAKTAFSTDSTERIFLQPLRMVREFKQLLDDIFPIQHHQQQYSSYFTPGWRWQYYPRVNGNSSNNNWSGLKRIVDSNPEGKDKLHDLKLRGGEMLIDILHNNKNKINSAACGGDY
ncbi:MAG TPA: hypothetical protein VE619_10990 [Nitrososphaeraceae archaeon]|nr:hypothetical protein [Nitrososphaeraceae archaeon]